ncbi:hypothetical protein M409DRAFT_21530 [Zasmidium cellare ATCC 36951]|uniref:ER transporter 6TM N-terminal domain-containing protein n=1 Tax=Zasmidium cellare ATCC 36951 TaxID=1080233 RepID=A0A6A6CLM6_ZASCE|nr:uncharacterized protein M409DRAFT_21530 [Zasmidium cellare ATCC 36951]KAF2168084.1 hypothetical protein M409DRAFT_21530 [Zasmidium cellare ATCC 36951]
MSKPSPSRWRKAANFWTSKTGIDWQNYKLIFKDTLPPVITLAANQAPAWASVFGSLGYLVPLVSIISHPSPPRAEFLWIWVTNILGSCVSAAVTALAMFCVIKGREQSGGGRPDDTDVPYNAVASTVAAIWLIVQVYITSAIRYRYPWTIWMTSACLIFSNYGMVYVTQFPNMAAAFGFLRQLLFAHLVAFGVSAGVSLCVFPSNSGEPFYKTALACAEEMREALNSNLALMEHTARSTGTEVPPELDSARKQHKGKLDSLQTKLLAQLRHAQNEVAWGRLGTADLRTLRRLLEDIMIPLIGLCQVPDVMERTLDDENGERDSQRSSDQYRELLGSVIEPFSKASAAADAGLECSKATIGVDLRNHVPKDPNADQGTAVQLLQRAMDLLVESKSNLLDAWRAQHGSISSDSTIDVSEDPCSKVEDYGQSRSNLHMLLYTQLLLWSICHRVQQLLFWIEQLKASQTLEKRRLIKPEWANFKALTTLLQPWKRRVSDDQGNRYSKDKPPKAGSDSMLRRVLAVGLHLYQKSTRFFASPASGFGLRVTCATMTIAIVAFLPSSQDFYIKQHLVWAQYTISFAMQGSAGQGVRALCFRVAGTVVAACLAWVSYYIVVGIPAGVLVFYWLSVHFPMYIMALKPRYYTVGTVSAFALTTILGNALQPHGSGQTTIVLGAIRLLAIVGGCFLASLWTVFPFPVSELDGARKSLGDCFASLAEYHTGFHEIVRARLKEGFDQEKRSPNPRSQDLEDMHSRLFVKCTSHLQTLRTQLRLAKWNIHMDGVSFSRAHYEAASKKVDDLARNLQLMTFASGVFIDFVNTCPPTPTHRTSHWVLDFRNLFDAAQHEGFGVAALLSLLSYAVRNETSLPPKLVPPNPERLWKILDEPERVAQQITQVDDPGAATFALMRIGTKGPV